MIRILLVDDHEMVRAGLRALLSKSEDLSIAGEAGSVAEAIEAAASLKPDVVLMDLRLPDGSGIDACREILSMGLRTRVLLLTSYADPQASLATVLAGASGYLLKDIAHQALVDAIREAALGRWVQDTKTASAAAQQVRTVKTLSPQEYRVLDLVVEGKTNKEIAAALDLSEKTVKNYLSNAFQKLGVARRSQAAVAFSRGKRPP
jgi:two-component system, NarL family, response regulator DevR